MGILYSKNTHPLQSVWCEHNKNLVFGRYQKQTEIDFHFTYQLSAQTTATHLSTSTSCIIYWLFFCFLFFLHCVMKQRVLQLSRSPQKRSCWEFTQTLNGHLTPFSIKSHRFYSHVLLIHSQGWLQLQNLMIQPLEMMNYLLEQSLLWSYKNVLGWGIGPQIIINEGQQHSGNFPVCSITTCLESNFSIKGELNM